MFIRGKRSAQLHCGQFTSTLLSQDKDDKDIDLDSVQQPQSLKPLLTKLRGFRGNTEGNQLKDTNQTINLPLKSFYKKTINERDAL